MAMVTTYREFDNVRPMSQGCGDTSYKGGQR